MCARARVCDVNREGSVEVAEPEDPSWRRCGEDWVRRGEDWVSRGELGGMGLVSAVGPGRRDLKV